MQNPVFCCCDGFVQYSPFFFTLGFCSTSTKSCFWTTLWLFLPPRKTSTWGCYKRLAFRAILSEFFYSWNLFKNQQDVFLNNTRALFATSKTSTSVPLHPGWHFVQYSPIFFTLGMSSKSSKMCFWTTLWLLLLLFLAHLDVNVLQELVLYNTEALFATPAGAGPLHHQRLLPGRRPLHHLKTKIHSLAPIPLPPSLLLQAGS